MSFGLFDTIGTRTGDEIRITAEEALTAGPLLGNVVSSAMAEHLQHRTEEGVGDVALQMLC